MAEKNNWRIPGRNDKQIYVNDKQILFCVFSYVTAGSVLRPNVDYSLGYAGEIRGKKIYIVCWPKTNFGLWLRFVVIKDKRLRITNRR